jgi:hypothetical protein
VSAHNPPRRHFLDAEPAALSGAVASVREIIDLGARGLLAPLFDLAELTRIVLRVLDDPAAYARLRRRNRPGAGDASAIGAAVGGAGTCRGGPGGEEVCR